MATRKIRLTMSGTQIAEQGPIIDVDFNGTNLDADVDVNAVYGTATIVKEYTVDVAAGVYNLDVTFKNDADSRDLVINKIEYADDGVNYQEFSINELNSNLIRSVNYADTIYQPRPNPDYDESDPSSKPSLINPAFTLDLPRTDGDVKTGGTPGSNSRYIYDAIEGKPITIYTNDIATFNITFS